MRYTFRSAAGAHVTVEADDEAMARHRAMEQIHGRRADAQLGIGPHYQGLGLDLIAVETPAAKAS